MSFPTNSARSKLAEAHPEFAVQNSSGFSERFVHSTLDLENYVLRLLHLTKLRILQKSGARLVDHQRRVAPCQREADGLTDVLEYTLAAAYHEKLGRCASDKERLLR